MLCIRLELSEVELLESGFSKFQAPGSDNYWAEVGKYPKF